MFQPCIGQYFINKNDLRVNTRSHQPTVLGSNTKKIQPAVKLRIQGSFPALINFSHLCTEITENLLNDIIYTACCLSQHSPMYSGPEYSCHIPLCYISRANVKMPSHAHLSSIEEDNSSKKEDLKWNSNNLISDSICFAFNEHSFECKCSRAICFVFKRDDFHGFHDFDGGGGSLLCFADSTLVVFPRLKSLLLWKCHFSKSKWKRQQVFLGEK